MNKKFLDLGLQPLANEYLKFNPKQKNIGKKYFLTLKINLFQYLKGYHQKKCLIIIILIDPRCPKL